MTKDGLTTAGDFLNMLESFDRIFGKTEIQTMLCYQCDRQFWEDEFDFQIQPHGELTQVCPHCGSEDFREVRDGS